MSRIIKSSSYSASDETFVLSVKVPSPLQTEETEKRLQEIDPKIQHAEEEAEMILRDAEEMANKIMQEAAHQADLLKQEAAEQIELWWEQKRQEAEDMFADMQEKGKKEGYLQGIEEGKALVQEEEQQNIQTARDVLTTAYAEKERIISEAESFLVELSSEIAKKIIGDELTSSPEKILEVVRRVLRRSRVHGQITLCVNHRYFEYIEEHRVQLLSLLDGQAELMIYPDYSVQDEGCVIRTSLGSVDARIDTQLSEIKHALLELARGSETDDLH